MNRYLLLLLSVLITTQLQADFFTPFYNFTDWIYEIASEMKSTIGDFFLEMYVYAILYWLKLKVYTVIFVWGIIEPLISNLNLTQFIIDNFSILDSNIIAAAFQLRIPEALNILFSAYISKKVLNLMGW